MTEILNKEFSRSSFLKGGGAVVAGASLAVAGVAGKASAASSADAMPAGIDQTQLDSWLEWHPDNTVTMKTSMGNITAQSTGMAQILAEELDLDVNQVRMAARDTWKVVNLGVMNSGSSQESRNAIRGVAVAARQALLGLAATKLGASAGSLTVAKGVVRSPGGASVTYGELISGKLFNVTLQTTPSAFLTPFYGTPAPLPSTLAGAASAKPVSSYKIVGTSVPRIDLPDKITGKYTYVQNVRVPGMLHGRVVRPRGQHLYGSGVPIVSVDESSIKRIPGVRIVRVNDFLGVVAEQEEYAIQAANQLKVVWKWPETATLPSSGNLYASARAAGQVGAVTQTGSVDTAFANAAHTVSGTYAWPVQMHGTLGPPASIVSVTPNGVTAFACTQEMFAVRNLLSNTLGVPQSQVRVFEHEGAGCYGENLNVEPVVAAALMSKAVGKPVRVQFMRWDDHGWDNYGVFRLADIRAGVDANGKIVGSDIRAWVHNSPMGSLPNLDKPGFHTSGELTGSKLPLLPTVSAGSGGSFPYYVVPNTKSQGTGVQLFRSAWLRGPGTHQSAFGVEQTIDQLAQAANMDPIAFRKLNLDMSLPTSQRLVALFDAVAKEAKWEARTPASKVAKGNVVTGQGFAVSGFSGTNVANLARVEVTKSTGKVRVTHLYGFGDAGLAVNPDAIESQFLGGMVFFLSKTMVEEVRFDRKAVTSSDWVTYPILRFKDSPDVIVAKVLPRNDLPATAVGEAGGQAVAAAVANAFYDATGMRVRRVPLTPARIRAVLANGGDDPAGYGAQK